MKARHLFLFWATYILVHVINIHTFPIFEDEGEYLLLADQIVKDPTHNFFIYSINGLFPLYGWSVATVTSFLHDSLLVGRLINVILTSTLVLWVSKIASLHKLPVKFEWASQILLLTSPIILLNSRIGLLDSSVMVYTAWYVYFTDSYITRHKGSSALGMAIAFLAAMLTKATGVFGVPSIMLIILRAIKVPKKRRVVISSVSIFLFAFAISFMYFSFFGEQISSDSGSSLNLLLPVKEFLNSVRLRTWITLHWFWAYYLPYFLLPLSLFLRNKNSPKPLIFSMILWLVTTLVIMISLNKFYYPRHILIDAVPLIVLLSLTLVSLKRNLAIAIFILAVLFQTNLSYKILRNPEQAPLALEDKFEYFENYTSGAKLGELSSFLTDQSRGRPTIVYLDGSYVMEYGLRHELVNTNIEFQSFRLGKDLLPGEPKEIPLDQESFVVVNRWQPKNIQDLTLVATFPVSFRHSQYVYKVSKR